jgi:hypothetical protein
MANQGIGGNIRFSMTYFLQSQGIYALKSLIPGENGFSDFLIKQLMNGNRQYTKNGLGGYSH